MAVENINIAIIVLFIALSALVIYYRSRMISSENQLKDVKFQKHSLSAKYGKMSEQFMPFLETYPYNRQNFRFIGSPVDGVQFEKDRIIFIEFKTGDSSLSPGQKEISYLVRKGKVEFRELRIK